MQGLQRLNIWNIKKLMLSLLYKLCFMMNQIEQFIKVGKAYVDALSKLDKNHPEDVAHLLEIFDCVHPDPGYHLGDMCYLRFTFDFFNHLYVEPTVMGAWQPICSA